jgi:general secretion pathway protein E
MTEDLRDAIVRRSPVGTLKEIANGQGFKSIRDDGLAKAAAGDTSVAEVLRVTAGSTPG